MAKPRSNEIYNCDYVKFGGKKLLHANKNINKSEGKLQTGKAYLQPIKVYIPSIPERETEEEEETNILIEKWRKILIVCRERTDVSLNMVNLELKRNQIKTSLRNRSPSIKLTKD